MNETALPRLGQRRSGALPFAIVGALLLVVGTLVTTWLVGSEIRQVLLDRAAAAGSRYAGSVVASQLSDVQPQIALSADRGRALLAPIDEGLLGDQVLFIKIWDANGRIIFSNNPENIGRVYPVEGDLARAWNGEVVAHVSDLDSAENVNERPVASRLVETYSPVRRTGTGEIIAVAELYERVDRLDYDVAMAERRAAVLGGAATLPLYVALLVTLRWRDRSSSRVRSRTRLALSGDHEAAADSAQTAGGLAPRQELAQAFRVIDSCERQLGAAGAKLLGGPVQNLSVALLMLDRIAALHTPAPHLNEDPLKARVSVDMLRTAISQALAEVRSMSVWLELPDLEPLRLSDVVRRAATADGLYAARPVRLDLEESTRDYPLAVKSSVYRLVQWALAGADRRGRSTERVVRFRQFASEVLVEISDGVPAATEALAFHPPDPGPGDVEEGMALTAFQSRLASIGGVLLVESLGNRGKRLTCTIRWPA